MKNVAIVGALSLAALWGCGQTTYRHAEAPAPGAVHAEHEHFEEEEEEEYAVALADVPRAILEAAARAVPGATWLSAMVEVEDGEAVFELFGLVDGKPIEVELSAAGEVLEIERE